MARLKIDPPTQYIFNTNIQVRISDVNYGGHVGNDSILGLMHDARLRFLIKLGFKSEIDITENIGIIVADVAIQYKSECSLPQKCSLPLFRT